MTRFLLVAMVALSIVGCKKLHVPTSCTLTDDQRGSFLHRTPTLPIPVYLDPSFGSWQKHELRSAIEEWNTFGKLALKQPVFKMMGERAIPGFKTYFSGWDYCGETGDAGVQIMRESSSEHWKAIGHGDTTAGVTHACGLGSGDGQVRTMITMNAVELGSDLFRAVALHELGHSMGLNHSCDAKNGDRYDWASCSMLSMKHPYRTAVMTGESNMGAVTSNGVTRLSGQIAQHLEQNDVDRAYCLYTGAVQTD